jgi:hypothetical protein
VYVRVRLAGTPLERDEGEYAYAGQLILDGVPPYDLVYNMKFPGTYYAYALVMALFGQTEWAIRIGLLCLHLATAGVLFLLVRRLAGGLIAAITVCTFMLLALDRWTMGVFGHATHFVLLPAVASLLALDTGIRTGQAWQVVAAGLLAALAVSMKQHALFFALLTVALAVWPASPAVAPMSSRARRVMLVTAGLAAFAMLLAGGLAASGVLTRFWFWTVQDAAADVSEVPADKAVAELGFAVRYITQATAPIWYAAAAGAVLLFAVRWPVAIRRTIVAWFAAALLSILPGFYFRQHYFIMLLPVLALFVAIAHVSLDRILARFAGPAAARAMTLLAFIALGGTYVVTEATYLFRMGGGELSRSLYGTNPFVESPEIGRYLKARTSKEDRILVLGSEPQILFYADRRSATGYIYMYGLMEAQPYASRMQDEMMREVEAARPAYLVFAAVPTSWMAQPHSDKRVLSWANEYTARCYERVGIADVHPDAHPTLHWDTDASTYRATSSSQVLTFRRKTGC